MTQPDNEVLGEFQKLLDRAHVANQGEIKTVKDDFVALNEKLRTDIEAKVEAKAVERETKRDTDIAEKFAAQTRLLKERTAQPPAGFGGNTGGDGDPRTLGQRFADSEQFKAWMAIERTRQPLHLSVKGRIRQPIEVKVATTIVETGLPMLPTRVGFFAPPTLPLVMRDLVTVVPLTSGNAIEYVLETWNYNADYQLLEGDTKAQGDVTYEEKTAAVRTLAWWVKVSRQMMADAPYFAATVDSQLLYGLQKKEDREILLGSGASGHLWGIATQAPVLPLGVLTDITTSFDQVLAAIAYLGSLGYSPTAIVLNPLGWAQMQIQKTDQGIYILGGPPQGNASKTLWGLPVVLNSSMPADSFLVGDFPPNAALFDREAPSVDIAYENEDDFIKNLVTIRCEERVALAVYRPTAFVAGGVAPPVGAARAVNGGKKKE